MTGKNRLPRLDLHCHLDGSLSQGCIEELLGRSVKLEELQADMDCQSLAEYLEKFEIPLECLPKWQMPSAVCDPHVSKFLSDPFLFAAFLFKNTLPALL